MIRASVLVGAALSLVACSGVKNYELGLQGTPDLNLNDDKNPTPVQVKVLRLKGDGAVTAFRAASFDALWENAAAVPGIDLQGAVLSEYVPVPPTGGGGTPGAPVDARVVIKLDQVPPEVTHIGVLANFNTAEAGKDRLVIPRDTLGDEDVWLVGSALSATAPAPAPKQD
jgi:predicted component of type VI protein secretion system